MLPHLPFFTTDRPVSPPRRPLQGLTEAMLRYRYPPPPPPSSWSDVIPFSLGICSAHIPCQLAIRILVYVDATHKNIYDGSLLYQPVNLVLRSTVKYYMVLKIHFFKSLNTTETTNIITRLVSVSPYRKFTVLE